MNNKLNKLGDILHTFSVKVIIYLSIILFSGLAILNTLITAYFSDNYKEWTYYRIDNLLVIAFLFATSIFIFLVIDHKLSIAKLNEKRLIILLMIFTFAVCVIWVRITHSTPVADRLYVSMDATAFIQGDYSALEVGNYLYKYPYQLGIVALIELIYRVVGIDHFLVVQYLNSVAVCVSFYALYRIVKLTFGDKVTKLTIILLYGCLSPMFFSTYVYGNMFGLAFTTVALWMEIAYLKHRKSLYMVMAILGISLGLILKNNYSIVLIAMIILLFLDFLRNKEWLSIIFAVLMLSTTIFTTSLLHSYYSYKSGIKINEGVPMVSFIAMGLQEGWFGKGTYNKYTVNTYETAHYNEEKATEVSMDYIKNRFTYFKENKGKALSFFSEKIALQWTEPTYMSIWESNCANNHNKEISKFTQSMYVGFWHNLVVGFMNFYQSFIWICAAVYIIIKRKSLDAKHMFLAIIIIGGFLCHLLWEAKSQYIIQYFIFAIPYAACGFIEILRISKDLLRKTYLKRN